MSLLARPCLTHGAGVSSVYFVTLFKRVALSWVGFVVQVYMQPPCQGVLFHIVRLQAPYCNKVTV